jgi:tetratricopeptide (TPR) repeat protein
MWLALKLVSLILHLAGAETGAGTASDEVVMLRRSAQELLRDGQPAKALTLLQRARELDSLQADIDQMMNQCRAKLGGWVAPEAGGDWNDDVDMAQSAVKRNPDSMYQVGMRLVQAENLPAAMRVFQILSRAANPKPEHLKAYTNLRSRQEGLVAFHRDLAQKAALRGAVSEVLEARRNAYAVFPDNESLRLEVEKAEQSVLISREAFRTALGRSLASGDAAGAMGVLSKARVAHPGDSEFKATDDSLSKNRKSYLTQRLTEIDKMMDAGRSQDAAESMESLRGFYPEEVGLVQAQQALSERILRKRRKDVSDSLGKVFDKAMYVGDVPRAMSLIEEMRASQMAKEDVTRFAARVDSARSRERRSSQFTETFANARKALARGDTASAREWTQKALAIQPENTLAKGLLTGLAAQQKVVPKKPVKTEIVETTDKSAKVNGLVMAGISAYRGGDYKTAMDRWKEALELDPKCVQAERYLANVGRKQARLQ